MSTIRRIRSSIALTAAISALALATTACKKDEPPAAPAVPSPAAPKALTKADLAMLAPLPTVFDSKTNPVTDAKVTLGQMLYHEKRLSKGGELSCNSCHQLDKFGVDGKPTSTGDKGQLGGRNSPTVFNAAGHMAQFWDGRAADVEEQAKGPILNPVEMAMESSATVVATLKGIPGYVTAFAAAFPGEADPVTYDNLGRAIGAFERKLSTPAKLDKYLAGDDSALSEEEKKGAQEFVAVGCTACHNGALVGGAMYQKAGLVKPWPNQKDLGRFDVTKKEVDKLFFKVPSLRNIAKTAPYFHDGSVATLGEAIKQMADHQLGKSLTDAQVASIATFLGALTGEVDTVLTAVPVLPPAVDDSAKIAEPVPPPAK